MKDEMKNSLRDVLVYGTITIPGFDWFYLLSPEPVEKDSWMSDDTIMFYVGKSSGAAQHIVIRGPFIISYAGAGKTIAIKNISIENYQDLFISAEEIEAEIN